MTERTTGAGTPPDIRILVVDDHRMVLGSLAAALHATDGFEVVAAVSRSEDVVPAVLKHRPTVILLDNGLPGRDGVTLLGDIRAVHPACRVALMTAVRQRSVVRDAIARGALAVMSKSAPLSQLITTLRGVAAGQLTLDEEVLPWVTQAGDCLLNERERDVLRVVATGASIGEIAAELSLAQGTVRNVASSAIKKLGARNRYDATRIAAEQGWL
ncbi:response regulator transcription factor [Streptomyces sp. WAC07061]|uniref:response regulator transcription factor n=1 Tax=Streptomyces sp. WAC07061 TaxID=2487410 RepID=UPI0021AF1208|nr:response regulator transcription factor [Streptomyces sp. WAC07061]